LYHLNLFYFILLIIYRQTDRYHLIPTRFNIKLSCYLSQCLRNKDLVDEAFMLCFVYFIEFYIEVYIEVYFEFYIEV